MLKQIVNGRILTPEGWLRDGSVIIEGNKILEVSNCHLPVVGAEIIDAHGCDVVPGGIEMHVHGGGGRDFMEGTEDAFRTAVDAHMQHGTTAIFPTLSSSTMPMIRAAVATTEKLMAEPDSPVMGLHLEGHYLSLEMAGGQIPENIKNPDPAEYEPLLSSTRCIKRWDAAPELPGIREFGACCVRHGVLPSVAHTAAEYPDVKAAYEAGFTHATHFYNAMKGFHKVREYKHEGTVESVYALPDMTVENDCRRHPRAASHPAHDLPCQRRGAHRHDYRRPGLRRQRQPNGLRPPRHHRRRRVQALRPLGPGRQHRHDGPPRAHRRAAGRHTHGGRLPHGE